MELFLHFEEDVLEDQLSFLVSFVLQGSLWWDPAKQISKRAKICSEIKDLNSTTSLILSNLKLPSSHSQPQLPMIFLSPNSFSLLVSGKLSSLPLLLEYHLCRKTVLSGLQKTLRLISLHHATLPEILEWLKTSPHPHHENLGLQSWGFFLLKALPTFYSCWVSL